MNKIKLSLSCIMIFVLSNSFSQLNIETKFPPPAGYERMFNDGLSTFIRTHPLKNDNIVNDSYGDSVMNENTWMAVFDYDLGTHKFHQCADAAIYLHAKYNWKAKYYDKLEFNTVSGTLLKFNDYLNGVKYKLKVDHTDLILDWTNPSPRLDNIKNFNNWLIKVWGWAGTKSFHHDTISVNMEDIRPGDIFNDGSHVVSIVDVVINKKTGNKKYMLAQSYMRNGDTNYGEEQYVLLNPSTKDVWYDVNEDNIIDTPMYQYYKTDLSRFKY